MEDGLFHLINSAGPGPLSMYDYRAVIIIKCLLVHLLKYRHTCLNATSKLR